MATDDNMVHKHWMQDA